MMALPEAVPGGLRQRKKLLTRDRLLEAAFDLFATQGYERTTLPEIALRAGVAARTVSNYFPQKTDLVVAYREDMLGVVEATLTARAGRPPLERVKAALVAVARANDRQPNGRLAQRLLAERASYRALERIQERFRTALRGALEGAALRPGVDLDLAILALSAGHLAVIQQWAVGGPIAGSLERRVAALFEQWRAGVAP